MVQVKTRFRLLSLLLLVIFILSGVLAYRYFFGHKSQGDNEIVTLAPENKPTRILPKESGAIIVPNTDSMIYQDVRFRKVAVKMRPSPEQPLSIIANLSLGSEEIYTDSIDDILNNLDYYEDLYKSEEVDNSSDFSIIMPNKISFEKKLPQKAEIATELQINRVSNKRSDFIKYNKSQDVKGYMLQLGVVPTEMQAEEFWQSMVDKFPDILAKKKLILKKNITNDGKIFYFIMVGYYPSYSSAKYACRNLLNEKGSCIVTK